MREMRENMSHREIGQWVAAAMGLVTALTTTWASAQEAGVAAGISGRDAASAGTTEVAKGGFEAPVEASQEQKDATEVVVSAGGLAASGNSRSMALTSAARFRSRKANNQLTAGAAVNFARAAVDEQDGMVTTVENYQARSRYDRFLGKGLAAFLAASARRDRFQGLDLRLNVDPGLAYYFLDSDDTRLWTELGYDLQYDVRNNDAIEAGASEGIDISDTQVRHSSRLFVGYDTKLNGTVRLGTELEYLQGIPETRYWRLNWDAGVTSTLTDRFSISTTVGVKYDNLPLPGVETTDVTTAISLTYQLL